MVDEHRCLGMKVVFVGKPADAVLTRRFRRRRDDLIEIVLLDDLRHPRQAVLTEQFGTGDNIDIVDTVPNRFEVDVTRSPTGTRQRRLDSLIMQNLSGE